MILLSLLATLLFILETIVLSIFSVFTSVVDRTGKFYLWAGRNWSRIALLLFGIRLTVRGTEHIQSGAHYVYAANHSSYMDIPVLLAGIPDNLRLTLRKSLTRIPIWGWALLIGPFLILDRTNPHQAERTIAVAIRRIRAGASVLFFPEGTRTPTGHMQSFKRGAFHLAQEAGTAVMPVAIVGTYAILPRHKWLPRWGQRVELRIGEAVLPHAVSPGGTRAEEIRLMQETERRVRQLLEEA